MLLHFDFSNFKCFLQRQTLSLVADRAEDGRVGDHCFNDFIAPSGQRLLKGAAIFGANGSGKTTVMEAMRALSRMVTESAAMTDPEDPVPGFTPFTPFALEGGTADVPTAFGVGLVADGIRYEYRVAATRTMILHESLKAFPCGGEESWYTRDWDAKKGAYAWSGGKAVRFVRDRRLEGDTLGNMLFLSKYVASNGRDLDPVFHWFKTHLRFLDASGHEEAHLAFTLDQLAGKSALHESILTFLRRSGLGISGVQIPEGAPHGAAWGLANAERVSADARLGNLPRALPGLLHCGPGGNSIPLPWGFESSGTRRLLALAGPWVDALAKGSTVFVDNLDGPMHPLWLQGLLKLFFGLGSNPHGAQVILTSQQALLLDMNLLRRDQVWFTSKDESGEGHLYRLTEFRRRDGESLVNGYLSGRYGAIPCIPGLRMQSMDSDDEAEDDAASKGDDLPGSLVAREEGSNTPGSPAEIDAGEPEDEAPGIVGDDDEDVRTDAERCGGTPSGGEVILLYNYPIMTREEMEVVEEFKKLGIRDSYRESFDQPMDGNTFCQRQRDGSWRIWFVRGHSSSYPKTYETEALSLEDWRPVDGIRTAREFVRAFLGVGNDGYEDTSVLLESLDGIEAQDPRMAADLAQFLGEAGHARFRGA